LMRFTHDGWLSGVLDRSTFSVHDVAGTDREIATSLAAHRESQHGAFYFAKLQALQIAEAGALTAAGFRLVETNLALARATAPAVEVRDSDGSLRVMPARAAWREAVLEVAGTAFRYSRFHADPSFTRQDADEVKRAWIRSYFDGQRGDVLLIAVENECPVGFAALLLADRAEGKVAIIDLIGVRPDRQGRGIGVRLVAAALETCRPLADVIEVGTQAANIPSLRLYEACGFTVARASLVLHHHTKAHAA
jgi:GNAT superfamily N-acetyltransferase